MDSEHLQRRLAAIVIADVVGYTRLMERDEAGTHARLRDIREQLFQPAVAARGGHTVKTAGDGVLLEFGSADAALRCSIDVQRLMHARNGAAPPEARIDFRFGINLGDIIVDGADIAGDGVNVASRLETLAEPGGICVSAAVREQVHGGLDVRFADVGEQHVRNIARPIRVYRVELTARGSPTRARDNRHERRIDWRLAGGAAACAALLFVGPAASNHSVKDSGPPFMSLAVLPFKAGADGDKVSAERLTQALTTAIQHAIRPARVASFGLAAKYGSDQAHDPRRAGAELNVRYLVEGELRPADDANAVDVRLVDAPTGTQVWSRRLSSASGTDGDSDMIAQLSGSLGDALGRTESKRVTGLPKSSTEAVDRVLRANAVWRQDPSLKGTLAARSLYEEALRLDPSFAPALVGLGYTLYMQWVDDPNADRRRLAREIDDVSLLAIRVDPDDPNAWVLRTNALSMQGREQEALETNAAALKIDPYVCATLHEGAAMLTANGRPQDALALLERARESYGYGEAMQTTSLYACRAHLSLGHYGEAVRACETASAHGLDWWYLQLLLSAAYAHSGAMDKSLAAKARLLEQRPDMSIERFRALTTSTNTTYLQQTEAHLVAGLRKAGVPER